MTIESTLGLLELGPEGLGAGFHEIPSDVYHLDPCPEPSLSSSGIHRLLEYTPAHFAACHPRLTQWPDAPEDTSDAMDLGTVVHKLVLGAGMQFQVIDGYNDWRKDAAKALREEARANGLIPMLRHKFDEAERIAEYAIEGLKKRFGGWPLGRSEVAMIWQRQTEEGPAWCRALDDHLIDDRHTILDLKTTALSLSDRDIEKKIAYGLDIQAAHYLDGYETLRPEAQGRAKFAFVFVETVPPYGVRTAYMPEHWLTLVRPALYRESATFAKCLATNTWPGWDTFAQVHIPQWRDKQFMELELEAADAVA